MGINFDEILISNHLFGSRSFSIDFSIKISSKSFFFFFSVLLDKTQTKRALPLGAVEIGTIAETEPDDEDLETLLEDEDDEDSNGSGDLQLLDQEDLVNVKNINEGTRFPKINSTLFIYLYINYN